MADEFRSQVVLSYWSYPDGEAVTRAARFFGVPSAMFVGGNGLVL
jgi:hypothetical protein